VRGATPPAAGHGSSGSGECTGRYLIGERLGGLTLERFIGGCAYGYVVTTPGEWTAGRRRAVPDRWAASFTGGSSFRGAYLGLSANRCSTLNAVVVISVKSSSDTLNSPLRR
jgi:hypothetical protein